MNILKREPAVIIGIVAACVLAVVSTLQGEGIIRDDIAATIGQALDPTTGWALPIIIGIITRFFVFSPAKAAELKAEVPSGYVPADTDVPADDLPGVPA